LYLSRKAEYEPNNCSNKCVWLMYKQIILSIYTEWKCKFLVAIIGIVATRFQSKVDIVLNAKKEKENMACSRNPLQKIGKLNLKLLHFNENCTSKFFSSADFRLKCNHEPHWSRQGSGSSTRPNNKSYQATLKNYFQIK
jgi:hypothetical protein